MKKTCEKRMIKVVLIAALLAFAAYQLPYAHVLAEEAAGDGLEFDFINEEYEGTIILDDPIYFMNLDNGEEAKEEESESVTTDTPNPEVSAQPTLEPTDDPGKEPTMQPSAEPTSEPTQEPTQEPTSEPTQEPTQEPTDEPTQEPEKPSPMYTIRMTPPTGWRNSASAKVRIEVTDENGTGFKQIRVSTGSAGWADVTAQFADGDHIDYDVYDNGTMVVRITDPDGEYHEEQVKITCFDRKAPTVKAGIDGEPLHIEAKDDLSGVAGIQVNGVLFTTVDGGSLDVHFDEVEVLRSYEKLAVRAYDYAGNFSEAVTLKNPYYGYPAQPTSAPTATPKPTKKPGSTKAPSGSGGKATAKPTALPTIAPTASPAVLPTETPFVVTPATTPAYIIQTGPGQAFTQDGNMRTLDLLYSSHTNKQFISVQTRSGETYYLVIDYDKPIDENADMYETYFLNLVDDRDLLAVLSDEDKPTPTPTIAPTPVPTQVPTPAPVQTEEKPDRTAMPVLLALALLASGGAWWYFKLRKPHAGSGRKPVMDEYEFDDEEDVEEDGDNGGDE